MSATRLARISIRFTGVVLGVALLSTPAIGAESAASAAPAAEAACGADPGPARRIDASSCDAAAVSAQLERLGVVFRWASCRLAARPTPDRDSAPDPAAGDDEAAAKVERPAESQRLDDVLAELGSTAWREELRRCAGAAAGARP